ncbi:XF1762 family protein [Oscillospiraceae bacterium 44-5]
MDNRPYHMFLAKLDGRSHRISSLIDDSAFDCLMDMLHWKMPYQLRAFHCNTPEWAAKNPVLKTIPELPMDIGSLLSALPLQPMRLKDKRRQQTLTVRNKYGSYVLADTEDGYGRLYHVDGITSSLITRLEAVPITLQEASAYIDRYHRHNAGPKFHKFSVCLRVPGEPEPVGVAVAGIPKARHQMDSETLEINRCCTDPRYADVCSCLYARAIRIGRELGYYRFLTYTLLEESGSSLRAVGFQPDGVTKASANGWNSPSRPRNTDRHPKGEKLRWVLYVQ